MSDAKSGCGCLNIIGGLFVLALVVGAFRTCHAPTTGTSTAVEQQLKLTPHEQRIIDLKQQREGLAISLAIQREMAKKLIRDAMKMSTDPLPDPDDRQYLMDSMDKVQRRADELAKEIKAMDIQIAREQGQSDSDSTAAPSSPPTQQEPVEESPPNQ
jgi:hypothetical protein